VSSAFTAPYAHGAAHWQAVLPSRALGRRPKRIWFAGLPLVLYRGTDGVRAAFDRCPHRFAPLSEGRVEDGDIACPYHGWRFGKDGVCTAMPGLLGDLPRVRVKTFAAAERDGVIFVAEGQPAMVPHSHSIVASDLAVSHVQSRAESSLIDVVENILDPTHTHYTHKGLLRGLNSKRSPVRVDITGGPGWVEASYHGEDRQAGLISRLLEGTRTRNIGRFVYPGIVELEYWGANGLRLATAFHLRQSQPGVVDGVGVFVGPRQGGFAHLKFAAFKPLFHVAMGQDQRALKGAYAMARMAPVAKPVIGPLDFLREDVARIMAGEMPRAADTPRSVTLAL
jgi:nitrite reductase/ring-hydroxylating ferredoxin subunit